jgi:hypothetical protein
VQLRELLAAGPAVGARTTSGDTLTADVGHLGAIAITAAIRAGLAGPLAFLGIA